MTIRRSGLRILPGLWACLIVTAFVIAPIGVAIQGGSATNLLLSPAPILYVLGNSVVVLLQLDIAGTPNGFRISPFGMVLYGPSAGRCSAISRLLVSAYSGSLVAGGLFRDVWR